MKHKDKTHLFISLWERFGDSSYDVRYQYPNRKAKPPEPWAVPGRRYRLDVAFPEQKVYVEIDGGIMGFWQEGVDQEGRKRRHWQRGGHSTISGQLKDMERQNLLTLHGWRPLRFTTQQLESWATATSCIELVLETLKSQK